jgi:hypothetical protein
MKAYVQVRFDALHEDHRELKALAALAGKKVGAFARELVLEKIAQLKKDASITMALKSQS